MYRIKKILNHNAVIVFETDNNKEFLFMGKGIGFGKNVSEFIEPGQKDTVYSLQELTERGEAKDLVYTVSPVCLNLANEILNLAEKTFGT